MPKPYTFPTLYDDALQLNIAKLNEWEYLSPNQIKSGTLTWSKNGNNTGSISIKVNTYSEQPYIELNYKYRDESRNYKVNLVSMPSNLGKGLIWYFLCPQTNKRCRIIYSIGGYFLHRDAFKGVMYESQILSKKYRSTFGTITKYFDSHKDYVELYSKNFKKSYAGKPTKRFLRLMARIRLAESLPCDYFERLVLL